MIYRVYERTIAIAQVFAEQTGRSCQKKTAGKAVFLFGGEGGIRTRVRVLP